MRALLSRIAQFFEDRAGTSALARRWLDLPVPGGPRWSSTPGAVLLALVALELLTGFVLALHYSPSVTTAWASLVFLEERIQGGKLVRSLHAYGASAILVALLAHYAHVVWTGAYRRPRELTWGLGLVLAGLLALFAVTGTLLPWDQNGYWATRVRMGLAGATPIAGHTLQGIAQGGEDVGNLTLTRSFAVHAILLPGLLLALGALHLALRRRHALAPRGETPAGQAVRWFPQQAFRDVLALALALGALFAIALHHPAPLDGPADPGSDYMARPEWYFLPLYQLVRYFPPGHEFLGSEVVPAAVFLALLALPFVDRSPTLAWRKRLPVLLLAFVPVVLAGLLALQAALADAGDTRLREHQREAAADAEQARALFLENGGIPPEGPLALFDLDPLHVGKRVYKESCASCHALDGRPKMKGPDLGGYLSARWLEAAIRTPDDPKLWGEHDSMGKTDAKPAELAALVAYVQALESPEAAKRLDAKRVALGKQLFDDKQCSTCHEVAGTSSGEGPNLAGYGSEAWLVDFLKKPGAARFYGKKNKMPAFADKLSERELHAVAAYLASPEVREKD